MTQQIDIMPSILDYINYDKDYFAYGQSVFSQDSSHFLINYTNGIYQIFKDKHLLQVNDATPLGLYNLESDPLMKINVIKNNLKQSKEMEILFKAFKQQYNNRVIFNKTSLDH